MQQRVANVTMTMPSGIPAAVAATTITGSRGRSVGGAVVVTITVGVSEIRIDVLLEGTALVYVLKNVWNYVQFYYYWLAG